jgi:predicted nucleotidyltransferase
MKRPEDLVAECRKVLGEDLRSVVLYGSAARGEMTRLHSDYDVLVVANNFDVATLRRIQPVVKRWVRYGHPAPIFFTVEELDDARDVFPIEFSEIKETGKVLYGPNPLAQFNVESRNLRYQLEHELRSKLFRLRTAFLLGRDKPAEVRALLGKALSSFSVLFQATLRLDSVAVPASRVLVWEELEKRVPIDVESMRIILQWRQTGRPTPDDPYLIAEKFVQSIKKVIAYIDKH